MASTATGFWTEATLRDPKRQYRFIASFANLGESGCSWFVKSIDKPSISLTEASHEYLNHTFYYPGRVTWNSVSCTLVDPVEPDAAATMLQALKLAGYAPPNTAQDVNTASKSNSIKALGTVSISQIAADDNGLAPLERWELNNAWIKSVTFNGLDYSGDGLSEVTIEIRYDWATLTNHGNTFNKFDGGEFPLNPDEGIFKVGGDT
jgi:hypothetical protein